MPKEQSKLQASGIVYLLEPFYNYRDKDQKEIDLIIVQDGTIYPMEIKKTASPNKKNRVFLGKNFFSTTIRKAKGKSREVICETLGIG